MWKKTGYGQGKSTNRSTILKEENWLENQQYNNWLYCYHIEWMWTCVCGVVLFLLRHIVRFSVAPSIRLYCFQFFHSLPMVRPLIFYAITIISMPLPAMFLCLFIHSDPWPSSSSFYFASVFNFLHRPIFIVLMRCTCCCCVHPLLIFFCCSYDTSIYV